MAMQQKYIHTKKITTLNSAKRITETVGETEWKTALGEKDRENGKY